MVDITVTEVYEGLTNATTVTSVTVDTGGTITLGEGEFTASQLVRPNLSFHQHLHINIGSGPIQFLHAGSRHVSLFSTLRVKLSNEAGLFSGGPDGTLTILQNNFFDSGYPGTYSYSVTSSAIDIVFFAKPGSKNPHCGLRSGGSGYGTGRFFFFRILA